MLRVRLPILTTVLLASMASASPLVAQEQEPYLNGPPPGQVPLEVEIGFNLVNLTDVNEQNETIDFDGAILMMWKDPRLAHDPAEVGSPDFVPGDYSRLPRRIYQGDFVVKELYEGWRPHLVIANGIGREDRERLRTGPRRS